MAQVKNFFVVISCNGGYTVIDHPMKMCGYRPDIICCFGEPETDSEKELFKNSWMLATIGPHPFHHFH